MKPPILLIDGHNDPDKATWVEFYDTVDELCGYLEPWFVEEPHVILDATGVRLDIVRREYGPSERIELEQTTEPGRPDIVRKFLIKDILDAASDRGEALAKLIPSDPQSAPLETLWAIHEQCMAWLKANPPPRRSLLERIGSLLPRLRR